MFDGIVFGARKLCIRFSGSFFDGARVVVLVARQGRAACKSFLAIGIRTLVGSLARVYSAVSRKRARITEGLEI